MFIHSTETVRLWRGDCIDLLKNLEDNSIGSLVTDPPAAISFMNKKWDSDKGGRDAWVLWLTNIMKEAYRVLKPGSYGLVWALPRTSSWTCRALEDAGFFVKDVVHFVFASGFPKSRNISKDMDKLEGVEPTVVGSRVYGGAKFKLAGNNGYNSHKTNRSVGKETTATSELAKVWEGYGTGLKPSVEHWILIQKPFTKTYAENIIEFGVGAMNIGESRIPWEGAYRSPTKADGTVNSGGMFGTGVTEFNDITTRERGRYPSNLIHDGSELVQEKFDSTGEHKGIGPGYQGRPSSGYVKGLHKGDSTIDTSQFEVEDNTSASRFFFSVKATSSEKDEGLEDFYWQRNEDRSSGWEQIEKSIYDTLEEDNRAKGNIHPTVKSLDLMRYLIKLVTPPKEVVLDIFAGSGSTLVAAHQLNTAVIAAEQDEDYCNVILARIKGQDVVRTIKKNGPEKVVFVQQKIF